MNGDERWQHDIDTDDRRLAVGYFVLGALVILAVELGVSLGVLLLAPDSLVASVLGCK